MQLTFEPLPREGAKAFAAFRAYLDLGPQRSLAAVAAKLGKSKVMMERWSRRHDWTGRVVAHAAHLAEIERLAIEGLATDKAVDWAKSRDALRREAWRKGDELLALADEFLERWRELKRPPGFESIVRGIELGMRLKQFAAGMPSEIKEVNTTLTATVDVEWDIAIRKAYGAKAVGGRASKVEGQVVDVEAVPVGEGKP